MSALSDRAVRSMTTIAAVGALSAVAALGVRGSVQADPPVKKPAAKAAPVKAAAPAPLSATLGDNTPLTAEQKIVHALNRMAFGPRPGDVEKVRAMGLNRYIEQQLHPEKISDPVDAKLSSFTLLALSNQELSQLYYERQSGTVKLLQKRAKEAQAKEMEAAAAAGQTAPPNAQPKPNLRENMQNLTMEERDALKDAMEARQKIQQAGYQLVQDKMIRAVESERQFQEVMVDFWSNHFNIDVTKKQCAVYKISDERDVIRKHSFGKFRDLLAASAKSPAMLEYLDNAQSTAPMNTPAVAPQMLKRRKAQMERAAANGNERAKEMLARMEQVEKAAANPQRPRRGGLNENYAREIMELHTLGVDGGYTQKDVTEVARCLTGWTINRRTGDFEFAARRHDNGEKTVLGKTIPAGGGIQDGETVLDILSTHPSTMRFISTKLCRRLVADEPPASLVDKCVATWKRTGGDLREIYRTILTAPEFYSRAAYRQKIKSPFEYAVSSVRALGGTYALNGRGEAGLRMAAFAERRGAMNPAGNRMLAGQVATMGQPLYRYQAPTGYPEDSRKWVSSGALIARLNFSLALTGGSLADVSLASARELLNAPEASDPAKFVDLLGKRLLNGEMTPTTRATLLKQAQTTPGKTDVAASTDTATRLVALVLGSPEFQRR
jgi:uncharacterized protein (DUF1800 family)